MTESELQFLSRNERETERLGRRLAAVLTPGTVVALCGNLGAGKTRLVQAVAAAMGIDPKDVRSPTFLLIHEYDGEIPLYHFDAYRLRDVDEFEQLGAAELLESEGICFIEWADRVREALPLDHLRIEIEITGVTERCFRISATGAKSGQILARLKKSQ